MRTFTISVLLIILSYTSYSQQYLDNQLRLEPVWSRVADALGEPGSVESAKFLADVSGTKNGYHWSCGIPQMAQSSGGSTQKDAMEK